MSSRVETLERDIEIKREEIINLNKIVDDFSKVISNLEKEILEEKRKENGSAIPKERWGTHQTHCCKRHGCKYGQHNDCPVALGLIAQEYSCQTGHDMMEDCFGEDIYDTLDNYRLVLMEIESLTKNSSNGEIYRIHELVKNILK
jgi:hypothetical protein